MTEPVRFYCRCRTCWFEFVPGAEGPRLAAWCLLCGSWVAPVPKSAEVVEAER